MENDSESSSGSVAVSVKTVVPMLEFSAMFAALGGLVKDGRLFACWVPVTALVVFERVFAPWVSV